MSTLDKQRDAILAGLRLLQKHLASGEVMSDYADVGASLDDEYNAISAIYTNNSAHDGLNIDEINALCESLNGGDAFVVLQEGGSSMEGPYVSSWGSEEEANEHRVDCAKGSYRTSAPIQVPGVFAAFAEEFYGLLDAVVATDFEYAPVSDQETAEEAEEG